MQPQPRAITIGVGFVYLAAATTLAVLGATDIRYSGDHERTIPVWHVWIPVLVGMVVTRVVPFNLRRVDRLRGSNRSLVRRESLILAVAAAVFIAALPLGGTPVPDGWYLTLKVGLLSVLPSIVLKVGRSHSVGDSPRSLGAWYWLGPAVATGAWLSLAYFGPFARSSTASITLLSAVALFLLNSVLEEVFYRIWLQTRLEHLWGRWPAIGVTALLWAGWHVALQGTGRPIIDLATAIAHQGVLGLFLGYLWSRYHNPWALFLIHGATNLSYDLLTSLW